MGREIDNAEISVNLSYNINSHELPLGVILSRLDPLGSNWKRSAELLINIFALETSFYLTWKNLHVPICFRKMVYSSESLIDFKNVSSIIFASSLYYLLLTAKFISSNINIKWKFCLIYWNANIFSSLKWISRTSKSHRFNVHHEDSDSAPGMEAFFPRRP